MKINSKVFFLMFTVFARPNKRIQHNAYLPTQKYTDLNINEIYTITTVQRFTKAFGPAIVLDLNNTTSVFLPRKIVVLRVQ